MTFVIKRLRKMEIKTRHIIDREKKEITMLLYGDIGKKVDGDYFAQELEWADRNYDTVIIRINSDGGLVTQGLSIVSQLLQMTAYTIAQIDGVAASMAAIIPVACDEVRMNDYARMMIHSPYLIDNEGKTVKMSGKEKKAAESIKGILVDLLSKRGKSKDEISKLMNEETWFTAEEALTAGLIHSIVDTGRKELKDMSTTKLVACINNESFLNPNVNMKLIAAKLGLSETSDETAILAKMQERETGFSDKEKKLVDRYLDLGRKSGAVTDDNAEKMRRLACADFDLFVDMLKLDLTPASQPGSQERISNHIIDSLGKPKEVKNEKDFDWYQKNNPEALAKMEIQEPERFKKLFDTYNAQFV